MLPAAALQQGQKTFASVFIVTGQGCHNSTPWGRDVGYFLGGYLPPGTPNWHPVLKKNSPKIDTPF